jgi:hypothetical protein
MIVPATSGCQYLALSYVWGKSTVLLEDDSDLAKDQLPKNLPQTIEDAILTTKSLGYDYLWVDRYCIPQGDNEERRQQIYQMDLVYNRAQATIIAVAGDEPSFGLQESAIAYEHPQFPQQSGIPYTCLYLLTQLTRFKAQNGIPEGGLVKRLSSQSEG